MNLMMRSVVGGVLAFALVTPGHAATLLFEDFEDAVVTYTTSVPEFSDGLGDFFTRTDGSNLGGFVSYANVQGSSWFAAMDLDGEGAQLPLTMNFTGVNIAGASNLKLQLWLAEDDDGANEDWDVADFVDIDYQVDGGGFQDLLHLRNDGSTFNSAAFVDTDFDGIGDGAEITSAFALFDAAIAGAGNLLDLRITFSLNAGDEDIALDNLAITGDIAPIPVPAAAWLLGSALLGIAGVVRRRDA